MREAWRAYPLDGALLWFHPKTGVHVRWDAPATRALSLERTAPRVVMFGITNRCNLACGFCSRDLEAKSGWTVESAIEVLAGLSKAGVLEVAFGGGEPLAFRGFDDLVRRIAEETALAVHFTTNGTLLGPERLARLEPYVGQIRLSIYDDNPWEERVAMLAASGVRFGVNVLVTPERMFSLAPLLRRLARLGCRDVALLSYVTLRALRRVVKSNSLRPIRAWAKMCAHATARLGSAPLDDGARVGFRRNARLPIGFRR
jgi:MoaA/NifB/PqqE/SkfB family radical SAM enzyme